VELVVSVVLAEEAGVEEQEQHDLRLKRRLKFKN